MGKSVSLTTQVHCPGSTYQLHVCGMYLLLWSDGKQKQENRPEAYRPASLEYVVKQKEQERPCLNTEN